jgi:superfamily II DNA or RNA helicase
LSANKFEKVLQERPYQTKVCDEVINDWRGINKFNSKLKSGLIELPPGGGKTIVGFTIAKRFKECAIDINGWKSEDIGIGWICGRRNLLEQARKENEALIGCEDVSYISQFASDFSKCDLFDYKHKLLIIDEAHHEACSSMHNIINALDPEYMLGLSATPQRTDGAKLCFQKNYKSAGFYSLIDEGWLSQFDYYNTKNWKPETVVARYLERKEEWGKSIMFFQNREQCDKCVALLKAGGVKVDLVTGETDRDSQLAAFERDELEVLVNMFVLTEGFDCPTLKTVWVRDSGQLPTIQMAGRVLRPHPDIPVVNMVQSVQTRWPFTRTANIAKRQFVWSDDDEWERIDRNDKVDETIKATIVNLASSSIDMDMLKALKKRKKKIKTARPQPVENEEGN